LRKVEGVPHSDFEEKFGETILSRYRTIVERNISDGLLECDEHGIRLTRKGRFVGNEVFQQFLLEE
ncbi:MAG: oxygen-independent coproporphyrinogen III oxidase, partial [Lysinibacillus sp.]